MNEQHESLTAAVLCLAPDYAMTDADWTALSRAYARSPSVRTPWPDDVVCAASVIADAILGAGAFEGAGPPARGRPWPTAEAAEAAEAAAAADMPPAVRALLDTRVAEVPFTVRVQNCLARAGITKLRHLVVRGEEELLGLNRFGVTCLGHVKDRLAENGLRLGMVLVPPWPVPPATCPAPVGAAPPPPPDAVLDTPLSEMYFPMRAHRCFRRLGVTTLRGLIACEPHELTATKNFGATSLQDVIDRLAEYGLKLGTRLPPRPSEPPVTAP